MRISKEKEKVWTELEYAYAQVHSHDIPEPVKQKFEGESKK